MRHLNFNLKNAMTQAAGCVKVFTLLTLLTLGVGQMWGATQRYIYVGISSNYQTYKNNIQYVFNFFGGTSGGVKSGTYLTTHTHDNRTYYMYRVQVYDDNNKAQFKGNDSWWVPDGGFSVTLNGTTNNAVFFSANEDGWYGQFQENYQMTSTASLSASSTSITTAQTSTLTPSLSSNATYNEIKSTSYSVTTNPGSAGSVTSAGVFSATAAGTYTVTATVTYNAKGFSGITKTATATATITVTGPSLEWAASNPVTPTSMISGNDVTLKVVRSNTSNAITWEYTTDDGSNWSSLTPKSTSNSGQTAVWTIPEAHGATQTYKFRAKITANSLTTAKSAGVSVYGKKTIKVKNSNNWANFYIHHWGTNDANATSWPGTTTGISAYGSGQWKYVVIYSCYDGFVLNANSSGDSNQTVDLTYGGYSDGECYAIGTNSGKRTLSTTAASCPTNPTSVTTTATPTSITNTQMTIGGNIGSNGNDNITDYGFYWGTTSACGTKAQVGTSNTTGTISKQLTGLTAGTTYYFKTYATNGQGTTYGTVCSYKIPYSVTITKSTGCNSITPAAGSYYYNAGFTVTAVAATGYNFSTWTTTNGTTSSASSPSTGTNTVTFTPTANSASITATYTAKTTTITYSQSGTGYGSGGPSTTQTATYGSAMPSISGSVPTAANGYAFMGYYDAAGGSGTQYYTSTGASARTWNKTASTATLYAYFKKAEITNLTFSPGDIMAPSTSFTVAATVSPTPTGSTHIDWKLRYGNDNLVESQPSFGTGTTTNSVTAPAAGGSYKIEAVLRTGTTANSGTTLDSVVTSFSIASDHTVTVEYRLGSATGEIIQASSTTSGKPLEWTSITAPSITGYSFTKWKAGDGITIEDADANGEKTSATINYKANYDGKLIAIYAKKRMIYFYNTLSWSSVYVYFYSGAYWDSSKGTGAQTGGSYTGKYGAMTRITGTNIWYYDCEANSVPSSYVTVSFTQWGQNGYEFFSYKSGTSTPNKVVYRGDYNTNLPMFVPLADQTVVKKNSNQAYYYNEGYWMNYPENTGYTLRIYDTWDADNSTGASREYPFPFSEDTKMPLKLDVEFNFTGQVWFMIYRNDGQLLGKNYTMNQNYHETDLDSGSSNKIEIRTSAPGVYKFTLSFLDVGSSTYKYYVYVEYPVGIGDYRILYKDGAKWSQSTTHNSSWWHESNIIHKNTGSETKADTVSLYVAYGSSPSAKFQYVSAINASTGEVTWSDVASGTVSLSGITKKGVYNFIVSQPAGGASISLTKKELYDGNYYIRTDKAGNTKWDNFRARDHQMTYTEFSNSDANAFGDKFTHYYAKWCPAGTNVKFVVANDYSDCISDTLIQDIGNTYKNIDAGGFLLSDNNPEETQNRYSANIRFMYNEETNKISRAYVASSTNAARYFLVLYCESGKTILDDEGNPLDGTGESEREAIFQDKENFIYERILEITPNTRFKLYASYALLTPHQYDSVQYFAGTYSSNAFNASSSVILISGTGDRQKLRVIYDFKTNRLVAAWIPTEGVAVSGNMDIDADVMVLRDHQKAAECITFNTGAKLTDVKTVYGAMKFNRWTLSNRKRGLGNSEDNNKNHCINADSIAKYHAILPAGEQKSIYERSLYFVSFPFDVKLSEVFGFGNYWDEWYIEYYDGLNRAKNGYWMDSPPNWKFVYPEMYEDFVLNAYEGYILGLDLDFMGYDNTTFWANNISNVELYFPSREQMGTIQTTNVTIPALNTITGDPYRCTINRGTEEGDRRFKDSYWRCIGVPSYNEYAGTLKAGNGGATINWHSGTDYTDYFPFLYAWNMNDNTLTAQTGSTFPFKPMHAYLTQVPTAIYWTNVSATPSSIVARQRSEEQPKEFNWRLALIRNEQEEDQAYIRMANLEQVTDTFDFGQDLMKELNSPRSNIYSYIGYERVAANSMPIHTEGITIPLGLNIINAGEYTFSMPDGTQGVGITLIDSEANTRTSLSALDYTVTLEKADYNDRFFLEISPINYIPTGMENGEATNGEKGARKVLINGLLYIVRDGKMFDARGVRVE